MVVALPLRAKYIDPVRQLEGQMSHPRPHRNQFGLLDHHEITAESLEMMVRLVNLRHWREAHHIWLAAHRRFVYSPHLDQWHFGRFNRFKYQLIRLSRAGVESSRSDTCPMTCPK